MAQRCTSLRSGGKRPPANALPISRSVNRTHITTEADAYTAAVLRSTPGARPNPVLTLHPPRPARRHFRKMFPSSSTGLGSASHQT